MNTQTEKIAAITAQQSKVLAQTVNKTITRPEDSKTEEEKNASEKTASEKNEAEKDNKVQKPVKSEAEDIKRRPAHQERNRVIHKR